ncbi:hypothetical protein EMIHUDRAFT_215793 [Emiliania huxleyi CCMP1516]|uniref:tRNA:m(4)X modification enzyme TRM13 n=2 Tax=Emiliania huxleyi TaxID=2903 RepID=A0A0D3IGY6_EMIH1|nr:hypothetical protein EMIHUDRAFT_215793 [Emiliania huxleyi CCMP1516]EOD10521.1 hypothetical protein EMIHUDRAFT_215793 [Emiliania huxleyi CCMP1516]|eukprot:XP_005762950.1 hypothetical protein EMIHUDRAFT_215793 [Emiliania huxleyi CCMP1516]
MSERQEPTAGSKSQLKKQAKMLHKQQAKAEHAARGHSAMLHEARRLRERLNSDAANAVPDAALYPQLPRASACELFEAVGDELLQRTALLQRPDGEEDGAEEDGAEEDAASAQARSCRVIEKFLWRAQKYNDKYASQELSLLYQLYRLGAHDGCDLVVDIGGGNANLSCLIALVFNVPVICVEMDSPRPELRGEFWLPPHLKAARAARRAARAVRRVEALIQDYSLPEGYSNVLVLGKHLCGPGTDAGIDFAARASEEALGRKQSARAKEAARLAAAKDEARAAGKQLCRRFLRYGSCEDGGACRFHHCAAAPQGVEEDGFGSLFSKYREEEELLYCGDDVHSQQNRCLARERSPASTSYLSSPGCSLAPSPAAPSPGRLTAHGALGCSPPPVSGTDGAATAPAGRVVCDTL